MLFRSEQALGVQAPVVQANDGASEAAGGGNLPAGWDPYRVVPYVRPANPFDTNLVDAWKEVTRVFLALSSRVRIRPAVLTSGT